MAHFFKKKQVERPKKASKKLVETMREYLRHRIDSGERERVWQKERNSRKKVELHEINRDVESQT